MSHVARCCTSQFLNYQLQSLVKAGSRGLGNVYLIVPFIPSLLVKITVPIINIYHIARHVWCASLLSSRLFYNWKMVNNPSVHSLLGEEKLRNLSNNLLGLPNCGVWIHERQLYKLLKLSSGKYYGQRDCLTSIINGIEKGYWGNRRKPVLRRDLVELWALHRGAVLAG